MDEATAKRGKSTDQESGDTPYKMYRLDSVGGDDELGPGRFLIRNERRVRPVTEIDLFQGVPTGTLVTLLEFASSVAEAGAMSPLSAFLGGQYTTFLCKRQSLRDAPEQIREYDHPILESRDPQDGELVAVSAPVSEDGEEVRVNIHRFHAGDPPTLTSAGPHTPDTELKISDREVVGPVVGVIRRY